MRQGETSHQLKIWCVVHISFSLLNEPSEMHMHTKLGRLCFSVCILIFLFYFIIYVNLPDISSRERRDMEQAGSDGILEETGTPAGLVEMLSIIILEFEEFDNALPSTVDSIQAALGKVPIFIVADHLPYPPVTFDKKTGAQIITLSGDLSKNYTNICPMHFFSTQYVFVVPDAATIRDWKQVDRFVTFLHSKRNTKAVAVAVGSRELECHGLDVDLKQWSVSFHGNWSETLYCPLVRGSHGLLMETQTLKSLSQPLARPFPFTFYVQAKLKDWQVRVAPFERLDVVSELYLDAHSKWKHKRAESDRLILFYKTVGVKQETLITGVTNLYGCNKDTVRCFQTVVNDMPDYLYLGRWTPPCCLKALRETTRHVISVLEWCQVRYWLEGGSLLGATRDGDIIPWDYDVDIGIYQEDVPKCLHLTQAKEEKYLDEKEFVWEKATEGDFYRIQYSHINHLHVDIFPFYSKDGVMTKDTWFLTHKQDKEFPERFLQPLTSIKFVGIMASAPNSVREFLEYKFGDGVIEKPKYPNLEKPLR